MKFAVTVLAAAGFASALTPTETIVQQLNNVINATAALTEKIKAFQDTNGLVPLLSANTNTLGVVNNGTKIILALDDQVPLNDALKLPPPTLRLGQLVNESITAIIDKKPNFVKLGVGSVTLTSLQQLNCASEQFTNATLSRLPGGGIAAVSKQLTDPIFASFAKGLAAYQDQASNTSAATTPTCSPVNATSRGLAKVDQSGAGLLVASSGVTMVVAAALACFLMI